MPYGASVKKLERLHRVDYSSVLRCIGQDLELRGLKSLEIRPSGAVYVVRCGYQPPPAPTPVSLHYTRADIEELERAGQEHRGQSLPAKDFVNLVQILRAIGGYLDKNQAILVAVSNNESSGTEPLYRVEYQTRDGEHVIDDREGAAIYDMCVSMYKRRRAIGMVLRRAGGGW